MGYNLNLHYNKNQYTFYNLIFTFTENKIVTFSVSAIGTTPIQLTKLPIGTCRVSMKPFTASFNKVYWNKSATVTPGTVDATDGFIIDNGDFTELCDPTTIYVVAGSAGQKISVKLEY